MFDNRAQHVSQTLIQPPSTFVKFGTIILHSEDGETEEM